MDSLGNNCMEEILKEFSTGTKLFNNVSCPSNITENINCNNIKQNRILDDCTSSSVLAWSTIKQHSVNAPCAIFHPLKVFKRLPVYAVEIID